MTLTRLARSTQIHRRCAATLLLAVIFVGCLADAATAHPLGNFTINHFARIEVGAEQVRVRFVVDMAEIPAFQELQAMRAEGDDAPSSAALNGYLERVVTQYADSSVLTVDGEPVQLQPVAKTISLPPGAGGLPTLRVECDLAGTMPTSRLSTDLFFIDQSNQQVYIPDDGSIEFAGPSRTYGFEAIPYRSISI